jgi:hypothetical protein
VGSTNHSIREAILTYIDNLESVKKLVEESRDDARQKENELCAQLVEEYGHGDLAVLIRDSVRW